MATPVTGIDPARDGAPPQVPGYTVLARMRESAAAVEYVARAADGATVTLLVPRERLTASGALRRRLRTEADLAVRAAGPWTAPVVRAGDDCLVTPYRPALPLDTAVTRHGPLPGHALRILGAALAEALTRLHTLVPVHQGLAPHTVRLAADGPQLTGFGPLAAATSVGAAGGEPRLTLGYLTPEQVARHAPGPASDVFVLGLLLVYAASGSGPFPAATPDALATADAELGGVPEGLRPLLARCLAKDPAARPTPAQVTAELAPDGVPALLAAGWLPGPVMAELSEQAGYVMGLEAPDAAETGRTPTVVGTRTVPDDAAPSPRGPGRRALLIGGAGLALGAAGGWGAARAWGPSRKGTAPAADATPRAVDRTPPTALWHYKAQDTAEPALVWHDEIVVIPMGSHTVGLDLRTGKERWSKPFSCVSTPVPVRGDTLAAFVGGTLTTFSARTGTRRGTDPRYDDHLTSRFHGVDGHRTWFSITKNQKVQLVCYDLAKSDEVWRAALPERLAPIDLAATDDAVHVRLAPDGEWELVKDKDEAVFLSFDRATGKQRPRRSYGRLKGKRLSLLTPQGVLYTVDDWFSAYDLDSGERLWRTLPPPRALVRGPGDALYAADITRGTYRFDSRDGTTRWDVDAADQQILSNDEVKVSMAVGPGGTSVLRLDTLNVTAYDPKDGTARWVFEGVGDPYPAESAGIWRMARGTRTAVFSRELAKHYFALPIG
ncbi:PQQ-binding-like beta-propeller repeat protein [Streptomyces sp. NPDC050400]|uniref:outer membrane protein assembly factor BamB family protein n=1 Tax=Streptomyces sp. NPDC050400 TaxID=3365610 RepID=UPI0037A0CD10